MQMYVYVHGMRMFKCYSPRNTQGSGTLSETSGRNDGLSNVCQCRLCILSHWFGRSAA